MGGPIKSGHDDWDGRRRWDTDQKPQSFSTKEHACPYARRRGRLSERCKHSGRGYPMSEQGTVLVTGGSGFIGGWCVIGLLQQGYNVRATVRDLSREATGRAHLAQVGDPGNRLSFYAANLTEDAGWDAAVDGCDYVLHVASPLGVSEPKDPNELIVP